MASSGFDWKPIATFGGILVFGVVACFVVRKLSPDAVERVSNRLIDAFKEYAVARIGGC